MKIATVFAIVFLLFEGCGNAPTQRNQNNEITWVANRYAQLFEIGYTPTDTFIKLYTFSPNSKSQTPERVVIGSFFWGKSQQIKQKDFAKITNRNRFILLSTVFSRFFVELKQQHKIIGVDQSKYLSRSAFPQKEKIPSVQPFGELMSEAALSLNPDIVIAYFMGNQEKSNLLRLQSKKTNVLFCQSHLENHPLGRAEWIVLFEVLTNSTTENTFESIEYEYVRLKKGLSKTTAPNVMINLPYSGTWDVPKQNTYLSILLKDAKANPIWLENNQYPGTGSAQIGLELGYKLLSKAEYWINPGMCESLACIQNSDNRIGSCPPIKNHKVYQCDLTIEADGANEYWDLGAVHPEYVLRDFAKIFHADLPNHTALSFYFYRQLK
jgi:iron complex transport system substrate-binding protein